MYTILSKSLGIQLMITNRKFISVLQIGYKMTDIVNQTVAQVSK
jgi:hypothetical protein